MSSRRAPTEPWQDFAPDGLGTPDTIAVLLGASVFSDTKTFSSFVTFRNSALAFKRYLSEGLGLESDRVLDCFDDDVSSDDILHAFSSFVHRKRQELGDRLKNVVIYYVGHGTTHDGKFILGVRRSRRESLMSSTLSTENLAEVINACGRGLRVFLILDCCFAAKATRAWMNSSVPQAIADQAEESFRKYPNQGTALLCASSSGSMANATPEDQYTMFTGGLISVLYETDPDSTPLSISDLCDRVWKHLARTHEKDAIKPEYHDPVQAEGRVSTIPFFPRVPDSAHAGARRIEEVTAALRDVHQRIAALESEASSDQRRQLALVEDYGAVQARIDALEQLGERTGRMFFAKAAVSVSAVAFSACTTMYVYHAVSGHEAATGLLRTQYAAVAVILLVRLAQGFLAANSWRSRLHRLAWFWNLPLDTPLLIAVVSVVVSTTVGVLSQPP